MAPVVLIEKKCRACCGSNAPVSAIGMPQRALVLAREGGVFVGVRAMAEGGVRRRYVLHP